MSWSGFKKNVGRATTQVMMKTGHVEKTSDREYEVEERRYRTLESASLRLQKEAKGYLDSLRAMTASQMRIAETIDAFYGDSGAKDGVSRSYKQAVEDLDAETVKALDGPYRCVPTDLLQLCFDDCKGVFAEEEIAKVEWEMNQGRIHTNVRKLRGEYDGYRELMDYIYRTTVLEPINRFCAYFPDINECIKKRNHKMLDYDAMRAKVRKLTEKPDKDPAKLPRTEKETEMVSMKQFLDEAEGTFAPDLSVPSPPKALNGIMRKPVPGSPYGRENADPDVDVDTCWASRAADRRRNKQATWCDYEQGAQSTANLEKSPSMLKRFSSIKSPKLGAGPDSSVLQQYGTVTLNSSIHIPKLRTTSQDTLLQRSESSISRKPLSMPSHLLQRGETPRSLTPSTLTSINKRNSTAFSMRSASAATRKPGRSPWLNPSELEDIMAPLREQYIQTQTDSLKQAKVAYDQLNEQLTNELPQLIDLRVPYLDPSFEALVKIQLRFCAEAYSRMAQVQQFLDASTRDQYASGELDARVEDVLGQIRELSIAGTV